MFHHFFFLHFTFKFIYALRSFFNNLSRCFFIVLKVQAFCRRNLIPLLVNTCLISFSFFALLHFPIYKCLEKGISRMVEFFLWLYFLFLFGCSILSVPQGLLDVGIFFSAMIIQERDHYLVLRGSLTWLLFQLFLDFVCPFHLISGR